jgi:hypothetical protein
MSLLIWIIKVLKKGLHKDGGAVGQSAEDQIRAGENPHARGEFAENVVGCVLHRLVMDVFTPQVLTKRSVSEGEFTELAVGSYGLRKTLFPLWENNMAHFNLR